MRLDERVLEPELMDDVAQARAYAAADFDAPHRAVVAAFLARCPELRGAGPVTVVDLGCGPCDVLARLAVVLPEARFTGIDGAAAMLAEAPGRLARDGVGDRVELEHRVLPDPSLRGRRFDVAVSTSLLHHLHDPAVLWATVRDVTDEGAVVLVADLRRPADDDEVDALVTRYAADEPEVLRHDFRASLRAAFRPAEVRAQLAAAGLGHLTVDPIGDRHLVVSGRR